MKMNYLDALDVMIATHQREAERHLEEVGRLTIAREVLEQLRGADGRPELLLKAVPASETGQHTQTPGEQITIRSIFPVKEQKKLNGNKAVKKPAKRGRDLEGGKSWRERVMAFFADNGPMKTPDVIAAMGLYGASEDRQSLYSAMSYLKSTGKLSRGKDGTYALVAGQEAA